MDWGLLTPTLFILRIFGELRSFQTLSMTSFTGYEPKALGPRGDADTTTQDAAAGGVTDMRRYSDQGSLNRASDLDSSQPDYVGFTGGIAVQRRYSDQGSLNRATDLGSSQQGDAGQPIGGITDLGRYSDLGSLNRASDLGRRTHEGVPMPTKGSRAAR